jgi:ADP-heptose:LPS heptosyltransferase
LGLAGGVRERIGFSTASLSFLLTARAERRGVPSIANNRELGFKAGLKDMPADYLGLVKVPKKAAEEADAWLKAMGIAAGRYIALAPGASKKRRHKYWQAEKWRELSGRIIEKGFAPLFCGAPWEKSGLERLTAGLEGKALVFASDGGVTELAAVLRGAKLFIGVDSGAMHLAASLGVKTAGLFGGTDPLQVGPMPLERNIVVKGERMSDISVEEVWQKVSDFIA